MSTDSLIDKAQMKDGELCRKEFEAWTRSRSYCTFGIGVNGHYHDRQTARSWEAWQASRQSLLSQLAITREALVWIIPEIKMIAAIKPVPQSGLFGFARALGAATGIAQGIIDVIALDKVLKSLSLDNPVVEGLKP